MVESYTKLDKQIDEFSKEYQRRIKKPIFKLQICLQQFNWIVYSQ